MRRSDWVVQREAGSKRLLYHHVGGFLYIARPCLSGRRGRYHCYALPDGGLNVPLVIGNEITLGDCCRVVDRHQEEVRDFGVNQVLIDRFASMSGSVETARQIQKWDAEAALAINEEESMLQTETEKTNNCSTKPTPGRWSWVRQGNGWGLLTPTGQHAATVYDNLAWFVWAPDGEGGQNDVGRSMADAKWCAAHAAKVAWYENGWVVPHTDDNATLLNRLIGSLVRVLGGEKPEDDWDAHQIVREAASYIHAGKAAVRYALNLDDEHCGPHERAFLAEVEPLLE
jgi:hypothetical protein